MTNRIFAAIFPPPHVVDRLEEYIAPRREVDTRLAWVFPEQWHLTTLFVDDCPERSVEPLLERLTEVAGRVNPFRVRLGGAGCFPDPFAVRVLYLDVAQGREELAVLSRNGRAAASLVGAEPDGTRFTPHLTLARARRRFEATKWLRVIESFGSFEFTAEELVVVQSHLRQGASGRSRYEVLGRLALGGGAGVSPRHADHCSAWSAIRGT
ncbi:RNA 2',3'-cyclic phosphodiesterase [Enemella dayhoffiae]|uniref:RNA 2',3'-cyclic phosphodiesterase n=1 Tax=Enemella dayhoffiae TaxID=2016507 RepID=A0A255H4T0_9ACTN|nr:RNA 2',3'-cyclic phosphodiesterase [Enemella dayhoffiae]OYO22680.1 RNA 2',3'-cyclic phosphodiesterase [Enemella dayhoffiae]